MKVESQYNGFRAMFEWLWLFVYVIFSLTGNVFFIFYGLLFCLISLEQSYSRDKPLLLFYLFYRISIKTTQSYKS